MLDKMLPYMVSLYGNPHSRTHAYGWESEAAVEKARKVSLKIKSTVFIWPLKFNFGCVLVPQSLD